ncbi:MAG: TolC family protein [Proteobacteria bacterium]|jgi:outer membrane protein, heavy metal efflux system|nr:TolC family protein [Pseudomonadota bacterium]
MSSKLLLTAIAVSVISTPLAFAQSIPDPLEGREVFTADQLVSMVWDHNPSVAERRAAIDVAFHRIETAGALDDPEFGYNFAPQTFGREGQGLNKRIEFSQGMPWPGTLKARKNSAVLRTDAARAHEHGLRLELAARARTAFAEYYFAQQAMTIHRESHALLGDLKSVAESRYVAGRASQQDVLRADLELANLDRHLLELARMLSVTTAQINGLLNRQPTLTLPHAEISAEIQRLPSLEKLQELSTDEHPDLKRLDAIVAAESSDVTVAEKAFYPDLKFTAGYNSLWDEVDKRTIVGLSLKVPLNRNKRRQQLLSAQASVRQTQSQRANQASQLLAELTAAYAGVVESLDSIELHENTLLPLADEFLKATLTDYESGRGGFMEVISAERQKLQIEEDLVRSHSSAIQRLAELELRAGGSLQLQSSNIDGVQ